VTTTDTLRDPVTLPCGLVLPNRIMKAALSEVLADREHAPDARLERLYSAWARGGYGLIVTGNVMVDGSQLAEPGNIVIEDTRHLDADGYRRRVNIMAFSTHAASTTARRHC